MDELGTGAAAGISEAFDEATTGDISAFNNLFSVEDAVHHAEGNVPNVNLTCYEVLSDMESNDEP